MDRAKVHSLIDRDSEELISTIREIVAIPSVDGTPEEGAPFGRGPKNALDKFVEIGKRLGFRAWAFDDQVGILEYGDESLPEMVAVLAHVDVVPPGDGWSCDPWEGMVKDGLLYGRGVADDKGPAISSVYALKALREAGVAFKRRVRVLVGTNEEKGSKAVAHYVESGQEVCVAGFTPDSAFPVTNGEKGIVGATCYAPFKADGGSVRVVSIDAGLAANAVPERAVAVIKVSPEAEKRVLRAVSDFAAPRDAKLACEKTGECEYTLTMDGLSFHGSVPQYGSNAAAHLVKVMRLMGIGGEQGEFLAKIDNLIGEQTRGENLGIMLYDDVAGFSSLCWGILKTEGERVKFTVNYRFPVTFSADDVAPKVEKALKSQGFDMDPLRVSAPLYMPEDCELVQKLMKVYRDETGDMDSTPLCVGGGTYAKEMPNMLAFGNQFVGENCHIHEADERWSVEHIIEHTKIMAAAIAALAEEA